MSFDSSAPKWAAYNDFLSTLSPGDLVQVEGATHIVLDGEHLICGSAVAEAADTEDDEALRWRPTRRKSVTCVACQQVIAAVAAYRDRGGR